MSYHDLSECTLTAEERRLEADSIVDMLCHEDMSDKEREFIEKMGKGWPVSVKQLFWLRDIKDKY